jgi:hypothetical protein
MNRLPTTATGAVAVTVAAVIALGGCGPPVAQGPSDPASTPSALSTVESWFAARDEAQRQGVENLVSFYDPEIVLDYRALGHPTGVGRLAALEVLHVDWAGNQEGPRAGPVFVSAEGALTQERVRWTRSGDERDAVLVYSMGAHGITHETAASSLIVWRQEVPADTRSDQVARLVADYLSAWSSGSGDAASELYADGAQVVDTLGSAPAAGRAEIGALVASPESVALMSSMHRVDLPDYGGPAIFVSGAIRPTDVPLDGVVLLLDPDSPDSCPGHLAVVLTVDPEGAIVREDRYHRVDDLVRCTTPDSLPSAWWDAIEVPDPLPNVHTATLTLGGNDIEVFNGTDRLADLLAWGFARYESAGLSAPTVSRVTSHNAWSDACSGARGLALNDAIVLCFQGTALWCADDCTRWEPLAKETLLHELAHAWMVEHVDQAVIAEFLQVSGKPTWADRDSAWEDRGVEMAAETIAWALMDEPAPMMAGLELLTCDQRAALFQTLTGTAPGPATPCQEPGELQP